MDKATQAVRYKEFTKEEQRRKRGRGSSRLKEDGSNYDGSAAQAWGVADRSAANLATRYETERSKAVRKGK